MKKIFINEKGNYSGFVKTVIFCILALVAYVLFVYNRTEFTIVLVIYIITLGMMLGTLALCVYALKEAKKNNKEMYDKTMNWTRDILEQKLEEVASKGYITESLKYDIIYELLDEWDCIKIDGTFTPVQKGENVYLIVELRSNFLHEKITMRKLKE